MTKLLISIANLSEAETLLGVIENLRAVDSPNPIGIVDLKDPQRGALGFVGAAVAHDVIWRLGSSITKSIALGELGDFFNGQDERRPDEFQGLFGQSNIVPEIQFVKIGLAGMRRVAGWQSNWTAFMQSLPETVQPVGVAYLDAEVCDSPGVEEVLELVVENGGAALLLDTFDKSSGDAIAIAGMKKLEQIISVARSHRVLTVVAGSVKEGQLSEINSLKPDFIGVRGAVCTNGRTQLDSIRLVSFLETFCKACEANAC